MLAHASSNRLRQALASAILSDTLALGMLNEATRLVLPIVTVAWPKAALARHWAFCGSIAKLRDCGIRLNQEGWPGVSRSQSAPRTGSERIRSRPRAIETSAPSFSPAATAGRFAASRAAC